MNCPQCGAEMKHKDKIVFEPFYHHEDECDYYIKVHREKDECSVCKIKNIDGEWQIPECYLPTEKQLKAIEVINKVLQIKYKPSTKKDARIFISEHMEESKQKTKSNKDAWWENFGQDMDELYGFDAFSTL